MLMQIEQRYTPVSPKGKSILRSAILCKGQGEGGVDHHSNLLYKNSSSQLQKFEKIQCYHVLNFRSRALSSCIRCCSWRKGMGYKLHLIKLFIGLDAFFYEEV